MENYIEHPSVQPQCKGFALKVIEQMNFCFWPELIWISEFLATFLLHLCKQNYATVKITSRCQQLLIICIGTSRKLYWRGFDRSQQLEDYLTHNIGYRKDGHFLVTLEVLRKIPCHHFFNPGCRLPRAITFRTVCFPVACDVNKMISHPY